MYITSRLRHDDWTAWQRHWRWGGALGNLIDHVAHGTVVDFVPVGLLPIFNIADVAIILGIGFMVLSMLFEDDKRDAAHVPSYLER